MATSPTRRGPMADPDRRTRPSADESAGFDRGFDGVRRRQAKLGLAMTPAERLQWLERTMEELRRMQGLARDAKGAPRPPRDA